MTLAYQEEVKAKWGSTPAYQEHAEKTKDYTPQKWELLSQGMDAIFGEFAACMDCGNMPESSAAQALAEKLQCYISTHYYHCTKQILAGLGQMYVTDERFKENIDHHAPGTAAFAAAAIKAYCA